VAKDWNQLVRNTMFWNQTVQLCGCVGDYETWAKVRGMTFVHTGTKMHHSLTSIQASRFPLLCVLATSEAFPAAVINNNLHPYCNGNANSVIIQHTRRI